jgi:hypothetical protein
MPAAHKLIDKRLNFAGNRCVKRACSVQATKGSAGGVQELTLSGIIHN